MVLTSPVFPPKTMVFYCECISRDRANLGFVPLYRMGDVYRRDVCSKIRNCVFVLGGPLVPVFWNAFVPALEAEVVIGPGDAEERFQRVRR